LPYDRPPPPPPPPGPDDDTVIEYSLLPAGEKCGSYEK
jgi:hypothetical protein